MKSIQFYLVIVVFLALIVGAFGASIILAPCNRPPQNVELNNFGKPPEGQYPVASDYSVAWGREFANFTLIVVADPNRDGTFEQYRVNTQGLNLTWHYDTESPYLVVAGNNITFHYRPDQR